MVQFSSFNGQETTPGPLLSEWNTTETPDPVKADSIPKEEKNLRVHMNLWLIDSDGDPLTIGDPPSDGQEVEVIIQDVRFPDSDKDGIFDEVDTAPNTFSNDFSDGTTTGTITNRGDQTLKIVDSPNAGEGVVITAETSGGPTVASFAMDPASLCNTAPPTTFTLSAGDKVAVTCGSVTLKVISGPVEISFVAADGTPATTALNTGNSLTFDPATFTFTTPATNAGAAVILVNGTEFTLAPGATITIAQFEAFEAEVEIEEDKFEAEGSFTLGVASNGIDPLREDVTLVVGTFTTTIPASSFELDDEKFEFEGVVAGIELEMKITPRGGGEFDFKAEGKDVDLTGMVNPVAVSLRIWGDEGTTSVIAEIEGHDEDDEGHDDHDETHKRIAGETPVETSLPEGYALEQNYPNPFNPTTTITFAVPVAVKVRLAIYNLRGQLIQTLHSGAMAAGRHSVLWQGTNSQGARVPSGVYVYKLQTKDFVAARKLVFIKSLRSEY